MFYSFSVIPLQFVLHHFLIYFANAIPSIDDQMLISFVRNDQKMQISKYSKQKYEAHLGIVYFMRKNWQCDKLADEFEEFERTECQKYRKYLDILYEYLSREYVGVPKVKPKFSFKNEIETEGPIIYVVNCLVRISRFYFIAKWSKIYKYKLNIMLYYHGNFKPKLLNEKRLSYEFELKNEAKLPMNEMILQLAIDTANECQANESLDGIFRQNFEENLVEMLKKAEEKEKEDDHSIWEANDIKFVDKHWIILHSKFDDQSSWIDDALFSEFVKGLATTNSANFFKMAKEYSNYLSRRKENENTYRYSDRQMISSGRYDTDKMKKHLTQKYETRLGVVYLMREKWNCDKILNEFNKNEQTKCQQCRKYLGILYEYLFRIYVEGKSNELASKFSAVKPILFMKHYLEGSIVDYLVDLISVVDVLNDISNCFWPKAKNAFRNITDYYELENEVELNYEIKVEQNGQNSLTKNKIESEIANLRKEFDQNMEKLCKNAEENAKEEKAKLEKAKLETENDEEKEALENEYYDKFGTFNSSPFS